MSILRKILEKRGIKDFTELDKEERETFESYDKILSKEKLAIEDVKSFCESQARVIESKWKSYDIGNAKKAELIPFYTAYRTLSQLIDAPQVEREALEKYLTQLHNLQ